MATANWRGTVGVVKPTYGSGSLVEFIRLLPEGVGVIPVYAGIKEHSQQGYLDALESYHQRVAELARLGVDLMHPEGAPPFMVRGYKAEQEIVRQWEDQYKIPIFTSAMTQTAALRALGINRFVGCTYYRDNKLNEIFTRYFTDAGFEVLGMEGIPVAFEDVGRLSSQEVYAHTRKAFLKHPGADAIYMLGSGWRTLDIIGLLEQDLEVPVVHPVPARAWAIQKRLHVRQPVKGYGRLLEEMP